MQYKLIAAVAAEDTHPSLEPFYGAPSGRQEARVRAVERGLATASRNVLWCVCQKP